ncbi:glycerol channel [Savitreella phatthalungensis]
MSQNNHSDAPPRFQSIGANPPRFRSVDANGIEVSPTREAQTLAQTGDLKTDYHLGSPAGSIDKSAVQHVDEASIETSEHHGNGTGINTHREPFHFQHEDQGATFKALQLQQGALNDPEPLAVEHNYFSRAKDNWIWREGISEFCGVFTLILIGDGVVAQVKTGGGNTGNFLSIDLLWGVAVFLGILAAPASGGHINPAVTFINCLFRKLSWRKLPVYLLFQVSGGFFGAAVVYVLYRPLILAYDPNLTVTGPTATAGIFCTYPNGAISSGKGYDSAYQFFSEFVCSSFLGFCLFAFGDENGMALGKATPFGVFFLIFAIGGSLGSLTGWSMSLCRDLGPRMFSAIVYGSEVFTVHNYYSMIPPFQSFIGCAVGAFLYDLLIYRGDSPINRPYFGLRQARSAFSLSEKQV